MDIPLPLLPLLLSAIAAVSASAAKTEVLACGSVAADAVDKSGESLGGIGSDITASGAGFLLLGDRGAGDGSIDYQPRFHRYSLRREGTKLVPELQETVVFKDETGRNFTGLIPDDAARMPPSMKDGRQCLDPEGLAVASDGRIWVADEYLPSIREFSPDGKCVRLFETPPECLPRKAGKPDFMANEPELLDSGREPNRGFEGLALLPDGKSLAAILQSGMIEDGGRKADFVRLFVFDIATGKAKAAYLVPFTDTDKIEANSPAGEEVKRKQRAFSAVAALKDGSLLALERDNNGADGSTEATPARWKAIVHIDLRGARNVLGKAKVKDAAPAKVRILCNFANLDLSPHGLPRGEMPAKWEGLAILSESARSVDVRLTSDNDFLSNPLLLRGAGGEITKVDFPRAANPQPTWFLDLRLPLSGDDSLK